VARRRAQWTKYRERIDPSRLVFIDESWTKTNMAPLRGWAPRGQRIKAKVPHGRWQTMTFLAALRHDRITVPWFFDGPINGEAFRLYVENVLVPTLQPGDIVIMDNLGSHKGDAVRRAIPRAGRAPLLPAEILARFEPNRTVLLQIQTLAPQGRKANHRGRLQCDRSDPRHRLIYRVRKLLRQRRL
jgi:transposase